MFNMIKVIALFIIAIFAMVFVLPVLWWRAASKVSPK